MIDENTFKEMNFNNEVDDDEINLREIFEKYVSCCADFFCHLGIFTQLLSCVSNVVSRNRGHHLRVDIISRLFMVWLNSGSCGPLPL